MLDLPRKPFRIDHVVGDADVDVQGRASNVAVLAWMTRAATAHSTALGWPHERYVEVGGFFVVRRHEIDYLSAANGDDRIEIFTWPSGLERASAERRYVIAGADEKRIIARGVTLWSFVDASTGRPKRIPPEIAATFDPAKFA